MDSPVSSVPDPSRLANRERALGIMATVAIVALLYFARSVLVPITLAIILSLLIAPLVRVLRRLHLGQTLSVLAAVVVLALSFAAVAGVIGSQLVRMAQSLPRYERTIKQKLKTLNDVTVGRFNSITGQAEHLVYRRAADEQPAAPERSHGQQRSRTQERSGASRESNTPRSSGGAQESGAAVESGGAPESGAAQKSGAAQGSGAAQDSSASNDSDATQGSAATRGPDDTQGSAASKPAASQASENPQEPGASQESSASEDSATALDLLIPPESGTSPSNASRDSRTSNGSSVPPGSSTSQRRILRLSGGADTPIPVELHEPPLNPLQIIERVLGSIWVPIETAGIVLVVLVFVLLEHDALRDRFIRIAGGNDIRRTTLAINDAGERLSRFFVSQFAVNCGFGLVIWVGLTVIGLPHPLLWAALAGVLRFVPYVGVWIAALCSALLAAAVDPHWTLALMTLGFFTVVELIAGQLVEPQLYGHTTGLSPLSVVIAAIFWSWLWGPIGLILSTPLTLCLLVAGRHIKALSLLDVLLGDTQALTMPERFYQRALSADSDEIIASARVFLKRNSFASYCDLVLMPALHLARIDLVAGAITVDQQAKVRSAMMAVIAAIGGESPKLMRRYRQSSVLENTTVGRQLRLQREQISGRWQGPLVVPAGSVVVGVGLGSMADELATELLVRILRDQKIDARHMSLEDLNAVPPPGAADAVSVVYVVSAYPSEERGRGEATADEMRRRFPHACIVGLLLPGMLLQPDVEVAGMPGADKSASSLGHAVEICLDMHRANPE
jgi:predicted PurR-regulated permease PerM